MGFGMGDRVAVGDIEIEGVATNLCVAGGELRVSTKPNMPIEASSPTPRNALLNAGRIGL